MRRPDQELSKEEIQANLKAWNKQGERVFEERLSHFSAIDQTIRKSRLLERYQEAFRNGGLSDRLKFGVSDALENAYGMGYPIRSRTVLVISEDFDSTGEQPQLGGRIFQINRGRGFEETYVDFELIEDAGYNFAKRWSMLSGKKQRSLARPYWLGTSEIRAFDITQPEHLRASQLFVDGRDTAFMFGGNSGTCFKVSEVQPHEHEIQAYFAGVTNQLRSLTKGG